VFASTGAFESAIENSLLQDGLLTVILSSHDESERAHEVFANHTAEPHLRPELVVETVITDKNR